MPTHNRIYLADKDIHIHAYSLSLSVVEENGQNNLAFTMQFQLSNADGCVNLLMQTQWVPEVALFTRTYTPRQVTH